MQLLLLLRVRRRLISETHRPSDVERDISFVKQKSLIFEGSYGNGKYLTQNGSYNFHILVQIGPYKLSICLQNWSYKLSTRLQNWLYKWSICLQNCVVQIEHSFTKLVVQSEYLSIKLIVKIEYSFTKFSTILRSHHEAFDPQNMSLEPRATFVVIRKSQIVCNASRVL